MTDSIRSWHTKQCEKQKLKNKFKRNLKTARSWSCGRLCSLIGTNISEEPDATIFVVQADMFFWDVTPVIWQTGEYPVFLDMYQATNSHF
jgi:hypothetical protein